MTEYSPETHTDVPAWVKPEVMAKIQESWQEALPGMLADNKELTEHIELKIQKLLEHPNEASSPTQLQELQNRCDDLKLLTQHIEFVIQHQSAQTYKKDTKQ